MIFFFTDSRRVPLVGYQPKSCRLSKEVLDFHPLDFSVKFKSHPFPLKPSSLSKIQKKGAVMQVLMLNLLAISQIKSLCKTNKNQEILFDSLTLKRALLLGQWSLCKGTVNVNWRQLTQKRQQNIRVVWLLKRAHKRALIVYFTLSFQLRC